MTIITFPIADIRPEHPHLRRFDVRRDLNAVADLVERCFDETLDVDGRRYIQNMRRSAVQPQFLQWAAAMSERAAYPFGGFVWELDGEIIGNLSLIPMPVRRRRIYLVANVAVQPEYRRRGIARQLTEAALAQCRSRRADEVWLHVRDDNPGAEALYRQLGFTEQARRTNWHSRREPAETGGDPAVEVTAPGRRHWAPHLAWLARLHPENLDWYLSLNAGALRPGLAGAFSRILNGVSPRQWAALRSGQLQAIVSWQKMPSAADRLWLAFPEHPDEAAVETLLLNACRSLNHRKTLNLELPAGLATGALEAAGFKPHQTLIWMQVQFQPAPRP